MAGKKDCMRAKFRGGAKRHGGMDAELTRFVTCRGYDSALIAVAADHNGPTFQVGTGEEFNGNEKRVHIDVKNRSGRVRA
jgi:hypothetical protein